MIRRAQLTLFSTAAVAFITALVLVSSARDAIAAPNLVSNGDFASATTGWTNDIDTTIGWAAGPTNDADGNAASGSIQVTYTHPTAVGQGSALQALPGACMTLPGVAGTYELVAASKLDALTDGFTFAYASVQLFTDGACTTLDAAYDTGSNLANDGNWHPVSNTAVGVLVTHFSARVRLVVDVTNADGDETGYFDNVAFSNGVVDPPTATATPTNTATNTPTDTPVPPTATDTPTPTDTPVPPTATSTPTETPTTAPTDTPTITSTPTETNTPGPTNTPTDTPTVTNTPVATNTPMPPTATNTPVPPTATNTPVPTATNTTLPTATNTPGATSTPADSLASPTNTAVTGPPPASVAGVTVAASDTNAPTGSTVSIAASVVDVTGAGEPGVACSFAITSQPGGDASLTATTAVTDASGVAQVELNVGSTAGPIVVTSNCGGIVGNTTVVAGASVGPAAGAGEAAELPATGTGDAQGSSPALYLFLFGIMSLIGCAALATAKYRRMGQ